MLQWVSISLTEECYMILIIAVKWNFVFQPKMKSLTTRELSNSLDTNLEKKKLKQDFLFSKRMKL